MGIDRTLQKIARKTSPGENKNMTNDGNPKAQTPDNEDLKKKLDGIGKALIVSVAWSYAEALERTKRAEKEQKSTPESQPESQPES
ncbi:MULTISPECIES: hypothetical protein [Microcoleaceae]|uniref:hypothetical protein n=2 Tax=Oscillatoriales TaxID=1150 RepID=UPI002238D983|nr:hypothetical protein [Lyngbya sp. CCAP 1446/10]